MGFPSENPTGPAVGISRFSPSNVLRQNRSHRLWRRAGRNHDFGGSLYYLARIPTTGDFDPWNERTGRLGRGRIMHEFGRVLTGMRKPAATQSGTVARLHNYPNSHRGEIPTATLKMPPSTESASKIARAKQSKIGNLNAFCLGVKAGIRPLLRPFCPFLPLNSSR